MIRGEKMAEKIKGDLIIIGGAEDKEFTRNSSIRPGTLLETRYSVTSACPCIISGPLRSMKKPTTATIAITPNRVRNARSILLFCDFIGAI